MCLPYTYQTGCHDRYTGPPIIVPQSHNVYVLLFYSIVAVVVVMVAPGVIQKAIGNDIKKVFLHCAHLAIECNTRSKFKVSLTAILWKNCASSLGTSAFGDDSINPAPAR